MSTKAAITWTVAAAIAGAAGYAAWQRGPWAESERHKAFEEDLRAGERWADERGEDASAPAFEPAQFDELWIETGVRLWTDRATDERLTAQSPRDSSAEVSQRDVRTLLEAAGDLLRLRAQPNMTAQRWRREMASRGYREATLDELVRDQAIDFLYERLTGAPLPPNASPASVFERFWEADARRSQPVALVAGAEGLAVGVLKNQATERTYAPLAIGNDDDTVWFARASLGATVWRRPPGEPATDRPVAVGTVAQLVRYADGAVRPLHLHFVRRSADAPWFLTGVNVGIWDPDASDVGGLEW